MVNTQDNRLNSLSIASLVYFLTNGLFLGLGQYNMFQISKETTIICTIAGFLIGFIPVGLFLYIMKNGNGKNIFEINKSIFGKIGGNIFNFILSIFSIFTAVILLYNLVTFLDLHYMPETSKIYVTLLFIIPVIYALSKGIESISKASQILIYGNLAILVIVSIGIGNNASFSNLFPLFANGIKNPILSSLMYATLSSMPIFALASIGLNQIKDKERYTKQIVKMYIISNLSLIWIFFMTLLVLGYPIISILKYPEYMILKEIKIFDIIERVENTMSTYWVSSIFISICMSIYFAFKNFESYFASNKTYKKILTYLIPIIVVILTLNIFKNVTVATEFNVLIYPIIFGIFGMAINIIIAIKLAVTKRKRIV